ncbi:hypothetical protein DEH80_01015 [Abyssibacter profundi]|uniref:DUF4124 domain-containing protein n=1 Tax=Abyssibacter profundi TaxID=2182787 RepID=A0A363UQV9_9GAMM|nr:hypothetical protein DEH80_01015 [Abyssibacter profundi]
MAHPPVKILQPVFQPGVLAAGGTCSCHQQPDWATPSPDPLLGYARGMRVTLLLSLLSCCAVAHAEIYRWTDANGQLRYSDRPPVNQPYTVEPVTTRPAEPAASQAPDTPASNPEQPPAPEPEATDPTTPRVDPAVLAQRCAEARERIGFYERTPAVRILFENDNGQTVRMTPAQRSSRLKQYREIASQSCR